MTVYDHAVVDAVPPFEARAQLCELDAEERNFDALVGLWIADEISYEKLMENYPSYESNMARRLLLKLLKILNSHT